MNPVCFFLILALVAIGFVVIGKAVDKDNAQFVKNGLPAWGTVIKNEVYYGRISVVRPVVRFCTEQGQTIEALHEYGVAYALPKFAVGQRVRLVYAKANPFDFRITSQGYFT